MERSSPNSDLLEKAIHEYKWSRELWTLNSELAEAFEVLLVEFLDYCKENNIPLQNMSAIKNMLTRIETLFNQITRLKDKPDLKMDFIRRKVTDKKSDGDVPVPKE